MANKNIRQVKLQGKYREVNRDWNGSQYKEIPWLNVSGVWLEKAGFKAGSRIEITVEDNLLIIKNCTANGATRD
jgi:toxic protein SymE